MADVKAIRDALAARVATIDGLTGYDTLPSSPMLPCGTIRPAPGIFLDTVTLDDAEDLMLLLLVLVSKVNEDTAQDALDTYLSTGSADIVAAIEAVGATAYWDYAICETARGYGQYTFGTGEAAQTYLGFEIPITVGVS